jgi:hypothetical protein
MIDRTGASEPGLVDNEKLTAVVLALRDELTLFMTEINETFRVITATVKVIVAQANKAQNEYDVLQHELDAHSISARLREREDKRRRERQREVR